MTVFTFANSKGGVGKTVTALNAGIVLSEVLAALDEQFEVVLVDTPAGLSDELVGAIFLSDCDKTI